MSLQRDSFGVLPRGFGRLGDARGVLGEGCRGVPRPLTAGRAGGSRAAAAPRRAGARRRRPACRRPAPAGPGWGVRPAAPTAPRSSSPTARTTAAWGGRKGPQRTDQLVTPAPPAHPSATQPISMERPHPPATWPISMEGPHPLLAWPISMEGPQPHPPCIQSAWRDHTHPPHCQSAWRDHTHPPTP